MKFIIEINTVIQKDLYLNASWRSLACSLFIQWITNSTFQDLTVGCSSTVQTEFSSTLCDFWFVTCFHVAVERHCMWTVHLFWSDVEWFCVYPSNEKELHWPQWTMNFNNNNTHKCFYQELIFPRKEENLPSLISFRHRTDISPIQKLTKSGNFSYFLYGKCLKTRSNRKINARFGFTRTEIYIYILFFIYIFNDKYRILQRVLNTQFQFGVKNCFFI